MKEDNVHVLNEFYMSIKFISLKCYIARGMSGYNQKENGYGFKISKSKIRYIYKQREIVCWCCDKVLLYVYYIYTEAGRLTLYT